MSFRPLARLVRRLILLGLVASAVLAAGATGSRAAESLYHVAKISVDTKDKNAVAARANGMAQAEMRAFKILLGRIVPFHMQEQLPEFTREEVEELVTGVAVRKEQTSTTRYIGLLDVRFNQYSVKELLVEYGIPFSEDRGPSISILPVVLAGDNVSGEGPEGWHQAWEGQDLSHSITPAALLRPRADLDGATVKAALSGDGQALANLRTAYGYGPLVLAVAEVREDKLRVRLAGEDGVGAVSVDQTTSIKGNAKNAARKAATAALAALENRWKVMQSGGPLPGEAAYQEGLPYGEAPPFPGAEAAPAAPREVPRNVVALVEFSGLRDWQQIRSRLTQIAGLQALEVNALSARGASVTFDFAGSLDRLQTALGQNGFSLDERDGAFVLRSQ